MNRYIAIAGGFSLLLSIGACRGELPKQDLVGYSVEIDSLNRIEAMNKTGVAAFTSMGADAEARRFTEVAASGAARAKCLKRQRDDRTPYTEAAKKCQAEVPIPGVDG